MGTSLLSLPCPIFLHGGRRQAGKESGWPHPSAVGAVRLGKEPRHLPLPWVELSVTLMG